MCVGHEKHDRLLVLKVEFSDKFPSEIKVIPIASWISFVVKVSTKNCSISWKSFKALNSKIMICSQVRVLFLFTCVHWRFPNYKLICLNLSPMILIKLHIIWMIRQAASSICTKSAFFCFIQPICSADLNYPGKKKQNL